MVGKDTVLACVVGFECRCCGRVDNLDSFIGACILSPVICPLGVLQDIISWFASKRKKYRFSYSPAFEVGALWNLGYFYYWLVSLVSVPW